MTGKHPTSQEESLSDVSDWQSLGKELLQYQLENEGTEARVAFHTVADRLRRNDELTKADLDQLRQAVLELELIVDLVEEIVENGEDKS